MSINKYTKIKLLFGKDGRGKKCNCNYCNPNCLEGYKGNCEEVDCLIDTYGDLEECFSNKHREVCKSDV